MRKLSLLLLMLVLFTAPLLAQVEEATWNLKIQGAGLVEFVQPKEYGRDDQLQGTLAMTYNVSPNLALGVASGFWGPSNHPSTGLVPVMAVMDLTMGKGKVAPTLGFGAGMAFAVRKDSSDFGVMEIAPGVSFRLSKTLDLTCQVPVQAMLSVGKGEGVKEFSGGLRIGLTIHLPFDE